MPAPSEPPQRGGVGCLAAEDLPHGMVGRGLDLFPGGPAEVVDRDPFPVLELPSQRRESRERSALPAMAQRGTFRRCPEDSRIGGAYIARGAVTFRAADSPGGLPVSGNSPPGRDGKDRRHEEVWGHS